jgi:hypothetical protein
MVLADPATFENAKRALVGLYWAETLEYDVRRGKRALTPSWKVAKGHAKNPWA